jgi:ABC transporter substrate binding protein
MLTLGDPVGTGLVESLSRPGGNITGTTTMAPGLSAKRLELLKAAVPRASRVLVLAYLVHPIAKLQIEELKKSASVLGIQLLIRGIATSDDLPGGTELAARHKLPAMYSNRLLVDAGGLMVYDAERAGLEVATATYVDRILKGAKPDDLPVEQPRLGLYEVRMQAGGAHHTRAVPYDETIEPAEAEAAAVALDKILPDVPGSLGVGHPSACQALSTAAVAAGARVLRDVGGAQVEFGRMPAVRYSIDRTEYAAQCRLVIGAEGRESPLFLPPRHRGPARAEGEVSAT